VHTFLRSSSGGGGGGGSGGGSSSSNTSLLFVIVMALYPQTTCFYKAVVNQLPTSSTEEYEVLFEDPSYADGYSPPLTVAQRYVISIKDKKGKSQT
jgi:hypothetical protein